MQEIQNSPKKATWIWAMYRAMKSTLKKMIARIRSDMGRTLRKGNSNQTANALTRETKCSRKVSQKYRIILYKFDSFGSGKSVPPAGGIFQACKKEKGKSGTRIAQNFKFCGK